MAGEFEVGAVTARVTADLTQFNEGMAEAKAEAGEGGLLGSISGLREGIASFADTAAIALAGIGLGMGEVLHEATDTAAQFEQTQTSFGTLLGSEQKAADLMKELMQFEQNTPFDIGTLTDATKGLLAYGVTQKEIVPHLKEFTDMSQGQASKLNELVSIYGQVNSIQQLNGREVLRLSSIGIPIYTALEQHFNKMGVAAEGGGKMTAQAIKKMIESGQITSQVFDQVLTEMTSKGGLFFNENIRQMGTFSGIMTSVRSQFQYLMLDIMGIDIGAADEVKKGGLFYQMREGAAQLLDFLKTNKDTIAQGFEMVINTIITVFKVVGQFLQPLIEFMSTHKQIAMEFLQGIALGFALLLVVLPALLLVVHPMILIVFAVIAAIALLYIAWKENFDGIQQITNTIIQGVKNVLAGLATYWQQNSGQIMLIVQVFWNLIKNLFLISLTLIEQFWKQHGATIIALVTGIWDVVKGLFQMAVAILDTITTVFLALLTGNWKGAGDKIYKDSTLFFNGLGDLWHGFVKILLAVGGEIFNAIMKPFNDAFNAVTGVMSKIKNAIDFTVRHSPSVLDIVQNGVSLVNDALQGINYTPTVSATSIANNILTPYGGVSSSNTNQSSIQINLPNAIISDQATAAALGEKIGDSIIQKLKLNIRI